MRPSPFLALAGHFCTILGLEISQGPIYRTISSRGVVHSPATVEISSRILPDLTIITPSPGADAVRITQQSQIVTSFLPEYTLCVGPAIAVSPIGIKPPYTNYSTVTGTAISCSTHYSEIRTTICATVLTGIATRITVSKCDEQITFSSQYGYILANKTEYPSASTGFATTSAAPTIQTLTTFYIAPWQQLTHSGNPPHNVTVQICRGEDNQSCVGFQQIWETELGVMTGTVTNLVDFSTTISSPIHASAASLSTHVPSTITPYSLSTRIAFSVAFETIITKKLQPSELQFGQRHHPSLKTAASPCKSLVSLSKKMSISL